MLFAGDQKVEHLNRDFFGAGITVEDNDPNHLFQIAIMADIGFFQPSSDSSSDMIESIQRFPISSN